MNQNPIANEKFEAVRFKNEKQKRKNKGFEWKNFPQLFSDDKMSYTKEEITLIKDLLFCPLPNNKRHTYWMIASGARRDKVNNPHYYENLLKLYPNNVNFPYEEAIDLDIHRTFPEEQYFKKEENLQKLKNVLMAFSMRNISIGYCQGFNYIVAKLLLEIDDEEDVFWIFTEIAEHYLPFDFYIKFTGVRTDMQIVKKIIKSTLSEIDENSELCISNLLTKCFISLFAQNVNNKILFCIWDSFFIFGNITLYRAFIWAIFLLYEKDMKKQSLETIHFVLNQKLKNVNDLNTLNYFLFMYIRINQAYIEHNRKKLNKSTKSGDYINQSPLDPEEVEKCDTSLPFCLCNKDGGKENFIEYNCLKWGKKMELEDNYFFGVHSKNDNEEIVDNPKHIDDMIIERQKHLCLQVSTTTTTTTPIKTKE